MGMQQMTHKNCRIKTSMSFPIKLQTGLLILNMFFITSLLYPGCAYKKLPLPSSYHSLCPAEITCRYYSPFLPSGQYNNHGKSSFSCQTFPGHPQKDRYTGFSIFFSCQWFFHIKCWKFNKVFTGLYLSCFDLLV